MLDKTNEDVKVMEELEVLKDNLKGEVYRLKTQIEDLEEIVAEYRARISVLEEEEEELVNRIDEVKLEGEQIKNANEELIKSNNDIIADISKRKDDIVALEEAHRELNDIVNSSYETIEELQNKQEGLKDEIVDLEKHVIVNKDLALKYETEAKSLQGMLEIEQIKQSNLQKQATALEQILDAR